MLTLSLHILIVFALMVRVLLRDDLAAPTRLAWLLVIAVLPFAGVLIYFLFGEINIGETASDRIAAVSRRIQAHRDALMREVSDGLHAVPHRYRQAFTYSSSINGFAALSGNAAELMPDAATARARIIEDIDAAEHHVHVLYYIWLDDETGTNTARALMRAAQRGVTCRVMADGLGSRAFVGSPLWNEMRDAGVQVAIALPIGNPVMTVLKSRLDLRNHRKITIIDGRITYCGSQNCADPEFRVKARYAPWVDIMLRVSGPVVAQNQLLFASDWIAHCGGTLEDFRVAPEVHDPGFVAQIMGDGPTERRQATPHLFSILMATAEHSVTITTPYFVPDSIVAEALCAAAFRGVAVRLILPKVNDSKIVAAASRSNYRRLLEAGVRIHEFKGGLLHAKTVTIDGQVSFLGSSNLDLRSFDLNYESNLLLHDHDLTGQIIARQEDYIAQSDPVKIADVHAWPLYQRMWNNAVATIGPVL
ncbi:cardiolipin synthase [Sedimentitalea arenosa]|uniref:Cardiolipin synthase n=1 Tax=Sedimentitalea arenosa TaxID=2798803 RepID=A0A8J7J6P0_9RHOB|nr:cardiolipin synthase [Arenibacterium arenosum]MBJ6369968.1 cardiolipin synthase [Arenibacterium arenosum]